MGTGIQICGLNGCGKSTLGRALAERLGFHFIDNEDLYFTRSRPDAPYANPRSREEVENLLMQTVSRHPDFVFAAVRGDYGAAILPLYSYVVVIEVPKEIRFRRVWERSFQKYGSRILAGGDLYEQEEAFFHVVESRQEAYAQDWLKQVNCPILRVDGTRPIGENVASIMASVRKDPFSEK